MDKIRDMVILFAATVSLSSIVLAGAMAAESIVSARQRAAFEACLDQIAESGAITDMDIHTKVLQCAADTGYTGDVSPYLP